MHVNQFPKWRFSMKRYAGFLVWMGMAILAGCNGSGSSSSEESSNESEEITWESLATPVTADGHAIAAPGKYLRQWVGIAPASCCRMLLRMHPRQPHVAAVRQYIALVTANFRFGSN